MKYKVLDSIWFGKIGIVVIDSDGNGWKAYIGFGTGFNVLEDCQIIAQVGVPVGQAIALAAFPNLEPEKFLS